MTRTETITSATRTYHRVEHLYLGHGEEVDVTVFGLRTPIRFRVQDKPTTDDFHLGYATWIALGSPDEIEITVTTK